MLIHLLPAFTKTSATLVGFTAILFWSSNVGLMRSVSESFGAIPGVALIYSISTIILLFTVGVPKFSCIPKVYLFWGSLLFVTYELCFSLSIGFAQNPRQAIEVGMVNYLWPTFTLIFAIMFNNVKANWLIFPGCIAALVGIFLVLSGETGIHLDLMWLNLQSNPLSYALALAAAVLWGVYCAVTIRTSEGKNVVTLFFALVAVVLWFKYWLIGAPDLNFTPENTFVLFMSAAALGLGYGAWNIGILSGNITLLAGASYFTPVLSAFSAVLLLNTTLSWMFWQGVMLVTCGAILCWLSTREKKIAH